MPHIEKSYEVIANKFYAGEYPRNIDDAGFSVKVNQIVEFGITDFIDLTEEGELATYTQFLPEGIGHYRFPIEDVHVPETMEQLHNILATIDRLIRAGRKVYVHCKGGIDRTGVVVACWFAYQGLSAEQSFNEYEKRWKTNPKSKMLDRQPLIYSRKDYIEQYLKSFNPAS